MTNQYSTLTGIVCRNEQYETRVITFCIDHTGGHTDYYTRSDQGKVHHYDSQDELDYKHRFLINRGFTECPHVSATPLC